MEKMRLIADAYAEIIAKDPQTALTKNAFRQLVISERIPSIKVGNKRLVSMESVEHFFCLENHKDATGEMIAGIRPIDEKGWWEDE